MKMHRRDVLRSLALGSAVLAGRPLLGSATAAEPASAPPSAPPGAGPFVVPPLAYAYDALEPHIDAQTMTLHHDKHHAAYVDGLNKAVVNHPELATRSVEDLVRHLAEMPEDVRTAVRNHGGGHANHSLFWKCLSKDGGGSPEGALGEAIRGAFGGFDALQEKLVAAGKSVFGSGWTWLALDEKKKLLIETTPNQDSPLTAGHAPLLGLDVWEHAYYLKYQNRRADYLAAIFNVIDWQFIGARYVEIMEQRGG